MDRFVIFDRRQYHLGHHAGMYLAAPPSQHPADNGAYARWTPEIAQAMVLTADEVEALRAEWPYVRTCHIQQLD